MLDGGKNIIGNILSSLTEGLTDRIASSGAIPPINGGPLGNVSSVLDRFGLDFSSFIDEFLEYYDELKEDIAAIDPDLQALIQLKPKSLARFPAMLQLGSKKPSEQYGLPLRILLWNKLNAAFPDSMFNGVKIPELSIGKSFAEEFPSAADFPGEC